jgi:hypothetical protein
VAEETYVIIELNHKIQPIDRGSWYEDPIEALLKAEDLGSLDGGGSYLMSSDSNEIALVDIRIVVTRDPDHTIQKVIAFLEKEKGAPKGSVVRIAGQDRTISFGVREGLGLYLNGTDLPRDVYASNDVNVVIAELNALLGDDGRFADFWRGPKETALYAYGRSFVGMRDRIGEYVGRHPLCQRSRLVQIA